MHSVQPSWDINGDNIHHNTRPIRYGGGAEHNLKYRKGAGVSLKPYLGAGHLVIGFLLFINMPRWDCIQTNRFGLASGSSLCTASRYGPWQLWGFC